MLNLKVQTSEFKNYSKRNLIIPLILVLCIFSYPCLSQNLPTDPNCEICASIRSYPQLASLDTDDGVLSQLIFNQLLGTDLNLTALNWMGLTQYDFEMKKLILSLSQNLNLSSPQAVLDQHITINQLITALATVAENEGTIVALNEILNANILTGTIQLGDMLSIETINESLANIELDFFTFLSTAIQLYNYDNVLLTNDPIAVDIPLVGNVSIQAQVVEPPNITCADSSMVLFSAGVRLKLDVDLNDVGVESTELVGLTSVDVDLQLTELELYIDIARGMTTATKIDGQGQKINMNVQPGLARVFLGSLPNSSFFDRAKDPITDLEPGTIGSLNLYVPIILDQTLSITAEGFADAAPTSQMLNDMVLPFSATVGSSSATISELLSELLTNTDIQIVSDIPIINLVSDILDVITVDVISNVNTLLFPENGIIHNIFSYAADPLLSCLGVAIGEVIVNGDEIFESCLDLGDAPDIYGTLLSSDGPRHVINNALHIGTSLPVSNSDGTPSEFADDDPGDDGVESFIYSVEEGVYIVDINVTNTSSDTAQLVGWIDFNNNGVFENNYERSIISSQANIDTDYIGPMILTWDNLPDGTNPNGKYARFRISSDPSFFDLSSVSPNGFAQDGEVEDYFISQAVLPIKLINFDVLDLGNNVEIKWETEDEINLDRYVIEKSFDGISFSTLSTHQSKSPVAKTQNYSHIDYEDAPGYIYYRLKSIDLDESFMYSEIKYIKRELKFNMQVSPNPFDDILNLSMETNKNGKTTVNIYNPQNQLLHTVKVNPESRRLSYDMSNYPDGIYTITIISGESIESKLIYKN